MSDTCMNHIEGHWKALTDVANGRFRNGEPEKALETYQEALYRAEVLNNHRQDCLRLHIPFMQVYIISCSNLANAYTELGRRHEAEKMLRRAVYYLLHLSSGRDGIDPAELQRELRRASVALLDFSGKTAEGLEKRKKVLADVCSGDKSP